MNSFIIDTHVHTSEVSSCGKVPACEVVKLYADKKYNALIITDHYYRDYFESLGSISWKEKIDIYLTGFRKAKSKGGKLGLEILLGIELRFDQGPNDYLVYGMDENFLYNNPELYKMTPSEFYRFKKDKGLAVYQAHPFRANMTAEKPENLDGIEVLNGNPRHNSFNKSAYAYASVNKLRMLSGSDFHQPQDLALGGLIIDELPLTSREFADYILGNKKIELIGISALTA